MRVLVEPPGAFYLTAGTGGKSQKSRRSDLYSLSVHSPLSVFLSLILFVTFYTVSHKLYTVYTQNNNGPPNKMNVYRQRFWWAVALGHLRSVSCAQNLSWDQLIRRHGKKVKNHWAYITAADKCIPYNKTPHGRVIILVHDVILYLNTEVVDHIRACRVFIEKKNITYSVVQVTQIRLQTYHVLS